MDSDEQLLAAAAATQGLSADLLARLIALEDEVPDLPSTAARNRLTQRVAQVLDGVLGRTP